LIVLTHPANESALAATVKQLEVLNTVKHVTSVIRVEGTIA